MATFPSAAEGVGAAVAIQQAVERRNRVIARHMGALLGISERRRSSAG